MTHYPPSNQDEEFGSQADPPPPLERTPPPSEPLTPEPKGLAWRIRDDDDLTKLPKISSDFLKKCEALPTEQEREQAMFEFLKAFGNENQTEPGVTPGDDKPCVGGAVAAAAETTEEAEMWESLKSGNFMFNTSGAKGNPIAGRWARFIKNNPEAKAEYDQLSGYASRAKFRASWAEKKYDNYKASKISTTSESKEEYKDGTYYSLNRMAVEEGGGQEGKKAALLYAMKCQLLGKPWLFWDEWTQQPKYLYIVVGFKEKFTKAWTIKKEHFRTKTSDNDDGEHDGRRRPGGDGATPKPKPKPKNKPNPKAGGKTTETPDAKRKATELVSSMTKAKKTKLSYSAAQSQAMNILRNIQTDENWSWAKPDVMKSALETANNELQSAVENSPFLREALSTELNTLKATHEPHVLITELTRMNAGLDPLVQSLSRQCRLLLAQHKARMEVS